ncbi:MAG: KH domain-containing protein [Chloroflexi bacterium]|nr:KH domain-containing protein [Chloroflexota bacterium]
MEKQKSIEVTGKTPEDAIAKGLTQLGLESDDVILEVLTQGAGEARVRLTPFPTEAARGASALPPGADASAIAKDVLGHLLKGLGLRTTIEVGKGTLSADEEEENAEPPIILNITGNDLSLLIGRKGETLAALQMMTRMIASHQAGRNVSIVVDVEHYKERREESLRSLALRLAEQVTLKGRTVALEPMPPNERRIIHIALRDHAGVSTQSVGEGDARKVTIIPKK